MTITINLLIIIGAVLLSTIGILLIVIVIKSSKISRLQASLNQLNQSFHRLDEQAKLIVKTDLELNKAQEELDRRMRGLDALHKTSRLISTTLDENEIFQRLEKFMLTELGFERNLIIIINENDQPQIRVNQGFAKEGLPFILANLQKDTSLSFALKEGSSFSSLNSPEQRKEAISLMFDVEHFVLTPILTQNGLIGVVFIGNHTKALPITEGDEELLSILANQIGQSLENARLFEQVFRSRQSLESKVQERTKELAKALEEVQNISKTKSEFISAVSHELRTPLTSVKGYAALLMTGKLGDIPQQVKERLEKINTHSDNLVKLINDLLDISRIESGRVEMNLGKCALGSIVENVHDLLTPQMSAKNINWKTHLAPEIPDIMLDRSQVERVFINLIGNAIKFTPEQGTISILATFANDIVTVGVSDTGIGISEKDMTRLFSEFFRVENKINQNVKGTGLGLVLAKKIVEAHKGKMWLTSKVGEGTTFYFTLPVEQTQKADTI